MKFSAGSVAGLSRAGLALAAAAAVASSPSSAATAFVARPPTWTSSRGPTSLHLEDHIADMIDGEVRRLDRRAETEADRLLKQRRWNRREPRLPTGFDFDEDFRLDDADAADAPPPGPVAGFTSGVDRTRGASSPRRRRDERLAARDPMRYCADRCVSTGNCDVFEDAFAMDPGEVVAFCTECVLSEGEEPCDVPEGVFAGADDAGGGLGP